MPGAAPCAGSFPRVRTIRLRPSRVSAPGAVLRSLLAGWPGAVRAARLGLTPCLRLRAGERPRSLPIGSLSRLIGWVLAGLYSLIPNYAIAIILIGLIYMGFVVPFTLKSTRSMLAMQKLQPKMKQLQQQHKDDRLALNQALTELYKQEGVNPFGACIPTLLPLPLLYILYSVIRGLSHTAKVCGDKVGRPTRLPPT